MCSGELEFHIDNRKWHLTPGNFMIVNSNEVHSVDSPLPNETIVLQIPLKLFEDYFTGEQFIWFSHEPGRRDERFMELIRELYGTYGRKACGYDLKMKSLFYQIMYLLVKDYRLMEVDDASVRKNKNLNKLSAITSYMKENYTGDLSLDEVARVFDYSPNYLSRMFRKYAGLTFKSYVQSIRLGYAVKDLDSGRYSITEVALRNGFSGAGRWRGHFRRNTGCCRVNIAAMSRKKLTY